ncbi:hypothetical protein E2C01_026127 [Portunus trituberculatus]|uniref:Uncharacterized protein n=1 Tax=Portunus trituberculatus TaxID=210409 RepID=A0A5B7EHZ5_PORTR|nr:hypothetical protein [Portunus trituberculatus]
MPPKHPAMSPSVAKNTKKSLTLELFADEVANNTNTEAARAMAERASLATATPSGNMSLMMRVMTALGRFRSSGRSAILVCSLSVFNNNAKAR